MIAPNITAVTPLSSTSFTVSWTLTDPVHNYIITWTNLRTGMMDNMTVAENTNSYTVTGLSGMDSYNVTVTANNSCGMMMSDPTTVYGKNVQYIPCAHVIVHICVINTRIMYYQRPIIHAMFSTCVGHVRMTIKLNLIWKKN